MSNIPPNVHSSAPLPEGAPPSSAATSAPATAAVLRRRETKNALAFLSHVVTSCGGEMRAPGYYSLNCMKLLDMVTVEEGDSEKPVIKLRADALAGGDLTNAYLFLHGARVADVERAVRAYVLAKESKTPAEAWEDFMAERVAPYLATLAPEEIIALQGELSALDEIAAAQVNATPPDHGGTTRRPDPNS